MCLVLWTLSASASPLEGQDEDPQGTASACEAPAVGAATVTYEAESVTWEKAPDSPRRVSKSQPKCSGTDVSEQDIDDESDHALGFDNVGDPQDDDEVIFSNGVCSASLSGSVGADERIVGTPRVKCISGKCKFASASKVAVTNQRAFKVKISNRANGGGAVRFEAAYDVERKVTKKVTKQAGSKRFGSGDTVTIKLPKGAKAATVKVNTSLCGVKTLRLPAEGSSQSTGGYTATRRGNQVTVKLSRSCR